MRAPGRKLDDGSVGPTVIPVVEVGALFDGDPTARVLADQTLYAAAREVGFACIRGLPDDQAFGPAVLYMLRRQMCSGQGRFDHLENSRCVELDVSQILRIPVGDLGLAVRVPSLS